MNAKSPKVEPAHVVELSQTLRAVIYRNGAVDLLRHDCVFHVTDIEAKKLHLAYDETRPRRVG